MSPTDPVPVWQDTVTLRSAQVDVDGAASLPLLCQLMQKSAAHHAESFGVGISHLLEKGLAWVLSRQLVSIYVYPRPGETIKILTWPTGKERLFWHRDFKILDARDTLIGKATTAWLVFDLAKRRPQRADSLQIQLPEDVEHVFPRRAGKIDPPDYTSQGHPVRVGRGYLDLSEHVNNVRYVEWALDALDAGFRSSHRVREMEANYIAEALCGDEVSAGYTQADEKTFFHTLTRAGDSVELFRARTVWR